MYLGAVFIVFGALGMALGGFVVKKFNMTCIQILLMCSICTFITIPQTTALLIRCDDSYFHGVNYPVINGSGFSNETACLEARQGCHACKDIYQPVCAGDIMYYSACHAGCKSYKEDPLDSTQHYLECSCSQTNTAVSGKCPSNCDKAVLPGVLALLAITILPMCFVTMPAMSATLRCVKQEKSSLAVGIQLAIGRLFGTIPGSPVFGAIFDNACLKESTDEEFCLWYDKRELGQSLTAVATTLKCCVFFFFTLAWYLYGRKHGFSMKGDQDSVAEVSKEKVAIGAAPVGTDNPVFSIT